MLKISAVPLLLTVSPILGNKISNSDISYDKYIETSKKAATDFNVVIVDANEKMEEFLKGFTDSQKNDLLFADNWHVNDLGHKIYFETILEQINLFSDFSKISR